MSFSSVSALSSAAPTQSQSPAQQISQDFKQLATSLQSGDLAGAQKTYSAIQKLLPNPAQSPQAESATASNPIATDFKALGQALQSGDVSSARSAFSQLQSDLKAGSQNGSTSLSGALTKGVRHHHGHHHAASAAQQSSSTDSTSSVSTGQPSSTDPATGSADPNGKILNILA